MKISETMRGRKSCLLLRSVFVFNTVISTRVLDKVSRRKIRKRAREREKRERKVLYFVRAAQQPESLKPFAPCPLT